MALSVEVWRSCLWLIAHLNERVMIQTFELIQITKVLTTMLQLQTFATNDCALLL